MHKNRSHHGLVDEPSALELDHAKSVCRVGPGVLDHAPFVPLRVNLHQLVGFLDGVGTGRDGRVLCRQLTTGASGRTARKSSHKAHTSPRDGAGDGGSGARCLGLHRATDGVEVNESANERPLFSLPMRAAFFFLSFPRSTHMHTHTHSRTYTHTHTLLGLFDDRAHFWEMHGSLSKGMCCLAALSLLWVLRIVTVSCNALSETRFNPKKMTEGSPPVSVSKKKKKENLIRDFFFLHGLDVKIDMSDTF